jgi:parvulin-like peptidyl-prolyl isomerase
MFAGRRGALALVLGMVLLAAGLAGCGGAAGQPDLLSAASVNGRAISVSDYQTILAVYKAGAERQGQGQDWQNPSSRANLTTTQQQALGFLINLEIAREQLKKPLTSADTKADRNQLTQLRASFAKPDQDPATQALAAAITPRAIELLAEQSAIQRLLIQQASVPSYHLRGILVNSVKDAQSLEQQAFHGSDFGQLAHDRSLDSTSGAQNGDLGTVYPGQYGTSFDQKAFGQGAKLDDGKYVIIPFGQGYALFELTQKGTTPLKSISDAQTQQNAYNSWLTAIVRPQDQVQQNLLLG